MGSAHYMSPEHFFNFRKADHRADIYSLGKILFEAIDGKIERNMPFKAAKLPEAETAFFQQLDKIIQAATAENKEERLDYFADQITPTGTPAPSILADDGVTLRLVPGGMIALPANSHIAWSDKRERESFKS